MEIERKFLVRDERWKTLAQGVALRQGYLSSLPERIVRGRIEGEAAMLTIKGRTLAVFQCEPAAPPVYEVVV